MKQKTIARIAVPALLVSLCASMLLGAAASYSDAAITASYRNIKLMVDGVYQTPTDADGNIVEPFIYEGTTYLPVRAVSEALGRKVDFDASTNTVLIGETTVASQNTTEYEGKNSDESIDIAYRDVKISVDGTLIDPKDAAGNPVEPFIYNGTTYLPVRAVSQALGKTVEWNAKKNTVQVGLQPVETQYTSTTSCPIGTWQRILVSDAERSYIARVRLTSVYLGEEAADMAYAASYKNRQLAGDRQYLIAKVSVTIEETSDGQPVTVDSSMFRAFSNAKKEYNYDSVVAPSPKFGGSIRPGQTVNGSIAFIIKQSDYSPRIVFGGDADGVGGLWFRATRG